MLLLATALLLGLTGLLEPGGPPASYADHAQPPGPVNAQTTYGWRRPTWHEEWETGRPGPFRVSGPGLVYTRRGMLMLETTDSGTVTATRRKRGHRTGRWEIRLRSRRDGTGAADFSVRTELVPAGKRDQHCGAQDIALESYALDDAEADFWIRTLPDQEFAASQPLSLADAEWHTFAVEVTDRKITWFVDAHAVRRERRRAALSGVPLTVRFSMVDVPGERMNPSRMQLDWLRYFGLDRPNAEPTVAPRPQRTTYAGAC